VLQPGAVLKGGEKELGAVIEKIIGVEEGFLALNLFPNRIKMGVVGFDKGNDLFLVVEGEPCEKIDERMGVATDKI